MGHVHLRPPDRSHRGRTQRARLCSTSCQDLDVTRHRIRLTARVLSRYRQYVAVWRLLDHLLRCTGGGNSSPARNGTQSGEPGPILVQGGSTPRSLAGTAPIAGSLPRPPAEPDPASRKSLRCRLPTDSRWPRAALAGALAATLLLLVLTDVGGQDGGVRVASPIDRAQKVGVVLPITLAFDRPMDGRSTQR